MQTYANRFATSDFLLQRPALFSFRQTATSDLCKRQAQPKRSRISGELPVSCTVFQVQMLRFRNDLTISGRVCWPKVNDLDVESSSVVFAWFGGLSATSSSKSCSDTPTAKARWVLNYIDFQNNTNAIKTNLFH